MHSNYEDFTKERKESIIMQGGNKKVKDAANKFFVESVESRYSFNFEWQGFPIIQYPQDIIALQELIYKINPNKIIETGFARGGSAMFFASQLENNNENQDNDCSVMSIDISVNKEAYNKVKKTKYGNKIQIYEMSSVSKAAEELMEKMISKKDKVMVVLDSMHTHEHVKRELEIYGKYVTKGSYLCVFDTAISYIPERLNNNKPWSSDNSPSTAIKEYLSRNNDFEVDHEMDKKLLISVGRGGYLRKL